MCCDDYFWCYLLSTNILNDKGYKQNFVQPNCEHMVVLWTLLSPYSEMLMILAKVHSISQYTYINALERVLFP